MSAGWSLFIQAGGETIERALLPRTTVGRGPHCDIRIRHPHISRHHFTVHFDGSAATLEHAHKEDGNPQGDWLRIKSYVNGQRVMSSAPLTLGDTITVKPEPGDDSVFIRVGESQSPVPPEPDKPWWKFW